MASKVRSIQRAHERQEAKKAVKQGEIAVTIGELFNSSGALQMLTTERLPATQAFILAKVAKAAGQELEAANETRLKLCQQYGTLSEDQTTYTFPTPEAQEGFEREWCELKAMSVTIKGAQIPIADLRGISITASSLLALSWLIIE